MTRALIAVVVDCRDAMSQANWWATALDHEVSERNTNEYPVKDPSSNATPRYFMNVQDPEGNEFCVLNAATVTGIS